jgi:hypothetical protein
LLTIWGTLIAVAIALRNAGSLVGVFLSFVTSQAVFADSMYGAAG